MNARRTPRRIAYLHRSQCRHRVIVNGSGSVTVLPLLFGILFFVVSTAEQQARAQTVGSKSFTENVILGEIATDLLRDNGETDVLHRAEIGGTRILWNALVAGEIDVYPEYTGTIFQEILDRGSNEDPMPATEAADANADAALTALRHTLTAFNIGMTEPLGFNNTYVLGMRKENALYRNVTTISDLRRHPGLRLGFSNEFMARSDGWPSLRARYRLESLNARGIDHDLGYRALESGDIDVIDLYSTDAEIVYYDLATLEDDEHVFPEYRAVLLYRLDLDPASITSLKRLEGRISESAMIAMNARAKIDGVPAGRVAADFLNATGIIKMNAPAVETWLDRLGKNTRDHLFLVFVSLIAAIIVSIPLGIWAARKPAAGRVILGITGVIYTIPSLALLVFMIPLLGIGGPPALVALFLYSLLPIVRNTYTGLTDIPRPLQESALALGLSSSARLTRVELPLASRSILAGIKTSAVINIGTATLGALIGAGGYGQPILTGIRLDDTGLILEGAVPAALLALVVQGVFDLSERWIVSPGLRFRDDSV